MRNTKIKRLHNRRPSLCLCVLVSLCFHAAVCEAQTIQKVDSLFAYGADHSRERRALEILERALKDAPADYELLWRAARSYYYVGDGAASGRLAYFERGIAAGQRAVAKNPNGVEGRFWLGASYGGFCREKGGLTAFRNVKKVRAEMEKVLQLKPAYEEGMAYTALGEIDRQLPGLFGGNNKRAIKYLEEGVKIASGNPEIRYALAEAYLKDDRKDAARAQLRQALDLPLASPRANEYRRAQEKAKKLLERLTSR